VVRLLARRFRCWPECPTVFARFSSVPGFGRRRKFRYFVGHVGFYLIRNDRSETKTYKSQSSGNSNPSSELNFVRADKWCRASGPNRARGYVVVARSAAALINVDTRDESYTLDVRAYISDNRLSKTLALKTFPVRGSFSSIRPPCSRSSILVFRFRIANRPDAVRPAPDDGRLDRVFRDGPQRVHEPNEAKRPGVFSPPYFTGPA